MKVFLLYLVKTLHVFYFLSVGCIPLFFNDFLLLSIMLFMIVANLYFWYTLNDCPLNFLEEYLGGEKHRYKDSENNRSFITVYIENMTGIDETTLSWVINFAPVISAFICLVKLYRIHLSNTAKLLEFTTLSNVSSENTLASLLNGSKRLE